MSWGPMDLFHLSWLFHVNGCPDRKHSLLSGSEMTMMMMSKKLMSWRFGVADRCGSMWGREDAREGER